MTLHIFNNVQQCELKLPLLLSSDDSVLLIEEAVYLARQPIQSLPKLYVLEEDLLARGLVQLVHGDFSVVNYEGFVVLSESHEKSISW